MKPVFITGFPKSGTTLITQLFNNLSNTSIDIELHFAPFLLKMVRDALLSGEIQTTVHKPDPLAIRIMELSSNNFEKYYGQCRESFQKLHTGWHTNLRWGNNCKQNIDFVPTLKSLIPDAQIIFMIRDPRDVWASVKHAKWDGLEYFSDMTYFLNRYRNVYEMSKRLDVITLRYEDLVTNPQSAFDLIGEEFLPEYIEGTGKTFAYRTLPIPKDKNISDEILTSRIGRYKKELPYYEIDMIEESFKDILDKYLYALL